ncbi:hypothetical protein LOZ36_001966 [Ophidiomyces ophidiicola]|nr:hypothetical protein LOZ36_001966 [Ophidiomyces ophidiicola]
MTTPWKEALDNAAQSDLWLAGVGCFAHVFGIGKTGYVVKKSLEPFVVKDLQPGEKRIYERLGHHPFILQYYGEYKHNTEQPNGVPSRLINSHSPNILIKEPNGLSKQPKLYNTFIPKISFIQILVHNFLLKEDGTLLLADFSGSMIDDEIPTMCYATHYRRPLPSGKTYDDSDIATIKDDIFALGTLVYEVTVGHRLYSNQDSQHIQVLVNERKFPNIDALPPKTQNVI